MAEYASPIAFICASSLAFSLIRELVVPNRRMRLGDAMDKRIERHGTGTRRYSDIPSDADAAYAKAKSGSDVPMVPLPHRR